MIKYTLYQQQKLQQPKGEMYKNFFKHNVLIDQELEIKLIENTLCVCKDGRLIIPQPLQRQAVLIGPFIKGKDGWQIDFMALTMIDPASSWIEIVELPLIKFDSCGIKHKPTMVKNPQANALLERMH